MSARWGCWRVGAAAQWPGRSSPAQHAVLVPLHFTPAIVEVCCKTETAFDSGYCTESHGPTQIDPRLAEFRTAWLDWGLKQSELERHFNLYEWQVKELRAQCRKLGLAPPAVSTHGGPPLPKLPSRAELEQQWLDGDLPLRPVADGLDLLAARLDVSVDQLRRHFRKIGFSPKHPMPRSEVKGVLDSLLSRPWCNRLGPNFAATELRRKYGMD